jgi:hypothetical protein
MRWANKREDALPPFDKMKWLLTVAWVALHNQLIRKVQFAALSFSKNTKHVQQPRAKETSLWLPVF